MLPPDWSPPPPSNVLVQVPLEPFNMTELDGSGNWTVNIPADAFMAHATGPSNFRFMITAEEANSSAIPFWTAVEFTSTGLPLPDTTAPQVDVLRPKDMQHVDGTMIINGTATDEVSLQRVELYVNGSLAEVVNVQPVSSFFFQFAYTPPNPLSPTEFTVKAFDTSSNSGAESVRVNTIRNIAVTNLTPHKPVVGQGYSLPINVTVANRGQPTEAFKVIVWANETFIQTRTVTLESGATSTLTFVWNTTDFVLGNYNISAWAVPLSGETNTCDNLYTNVMAQVAPTINARIATHPEVLNLMSKSQWFTVSIELPEGHNVSDIDVSSIMLNESIPVGSEPAVIGDYDSNGNSDLIVCFDRAAISENILSVGTLTGNVTLTVTGQLNNGTQLEGSNVIKVRMPGDINIDGKVDISDVALAVKAWGAYLGHSRWNPVADENEDNVINVIDLALIAMNYGKTYS
jgi:hypothetical protein